MKSLVIALGLTASVVAPAFGQTAPDTIVEVTPEIAEYVQAAAAAVVAIVSTVVGLFVRNFFLRQALQIALTNAAGLIVARVGASVTGAKLDVRNVAVAEAIEYVQKSAPDALKKWNITPDSIRQKIEAKVGQLVAPGTGGSHQI